MAQFEHPNVMVLIGVASKPPHELQVVIQHCGKGSLKSFLSSGAWPTGGANASATSVHRAAALRVASIGSSTNNQNVGGQLSSFRTR